MPSLCILTQYYPPEMGAPQARLSELAARLSSAGWQVEVLTALPNYPTGNVFPGYDAKHSVVETIDGLRVARVPLREVERHPARRERRRCGDRHGPGQQGGLVPPCRLARG